MAAEVASSIDDARPAVDEAWTVVVRPVEPARLRAVESVASLADGGVGCRGLADVDGSPARPATLVAGIYDDGAVPDLLPGPLWTRVDVHPSDGWADAVELDLGRGVLWTERQHDGRRLVSERFVSAARPGIAALRVSGSDEAFDVDEPLRPPVGRRTPVHTIDTSGATDTMVVIGTYQQIAAAVDQEAELTGGRRRVDRVVAIAGGPRHADLVPGVRAMADQAAMSGFDELLDEHERVWADRWRLADTSFGGDVDLTRAMRFAIFHLLGAGRDHGEVAIGARGLTGAAYRGHVFWDTDVFVLPALAALRPRAARAALMYRWNRLDQARERARADGRDGARFPWESAAEGVEATPSEAIDLRGRVIPVRTGEMEEHVVADVAWAVVRYVEWTGDEAFMRGHGDEMLAECARYWASRVEADTDATLHVRGVIGPDEYHEAVDDDAYTNVMARWTLRAAAARCRGGNAVEAGECRAWLDTADRLVDGFDPATGVYEQFAGYHGLEPVLVSSLGSPPLSADALLGHDRIQQLQIIKQPDVLMLHHMVPDEVAPGSLVPNLDLYLPRTVHGSSLSPAIMAGLLARAGRFEEAVELFELAAYLDLHDLTGTTAGGLHLATMGGVWQALHQGFLGVRTAGDGLLVDPSVPEAWGRLVHRSCHRGRLVVVEVDGDDATVTAAGDLSVRLAGGEERTGTALGLVRQREGWTFR